VPWLAATALLHSFTLYRTRGIFKHWALGLAAATFFFTILATWTTRTGLIQSVHAFEKNQLLVVILTGLLAAVAAATVGLMAWRWRRFESHDEVESLLSRDFMYYVTNLLLTLFAVAVAFGTVVVPLAMDRTVGPSTYNAIAQPLGVVTLALIAVCPLLAWRKTDGTTLLRLLILPAVFAAVSIALWLALGFGSDLRGMVGLVVCGFAAGAVVQFVLRSARRAAGADASLWSGLGRAFSGSRSRTAAYFVHFGMVFVVAGLLGSNVYKVEKSTILTVKPGTTASVSGYTLTYKGMRSASGPQSSTDAIARLEVSRGGTVVGTVEPQTDVYPVSGAAVRADILGGWKQDLFVVADSPFDKTSTTIALRMVVFPLIRFVWLGSILLCVGAAVSLWPKGRRQEQEAREAATAGADAGDGLGRASA
jgi:cytochrome c-type biogenesis protein CcmF